MVLQDLLKRVLSGKDDYGEKSRAMRKKLLSIYAEALSSHSTPLLKMLQVDFMLQSFIAGLFMFYFGVNSDFQW